MPTNAELIFWITVAAIACVALLVGCVINPAIFTREEDSDEYYE